MPQWKKLPNGQWVVVPSVSTYFDQIGRGTRQSFGVPDYNNENFLLRQAQRLRQLTPGQRGFSTKQRKTIPGSIKEAVKAIPGGVMDLGLSGAEAAIGVLTPFADLPIEKRLRKFSQDRAARRDPLYRDSLAVGVGQGLGQVAGLTGLTRIPGIGKLLGLASSVSLGISDQTRRIAEYEQRTGENIPWYRETMAHLLGGAVGLSEIILPYKLANMGSVNRLQKMLSRTVPVDPGTTSGMIRSALESTAIEGIQEGLAQGLQSMTARGLYDPNALEDLGASMMEDLKVGGIVGGIADVAATMLLGPHGKGKGRQSTEQLQSERNEAILRKHKWQNEEWGSETLDAINNGFVADKLSGIMEEYNVDRQVAEDIFELFNGEFSALPLGFETPLLESGIELEQIESIRDELAERTSSAITILQGISERAGDNESKRDYANAADAVRRIQLTRLGTLNTSIEKLGGGWRNLGGISDTEEYQRYWNPFGKDVLKHPDYDQLESHLQSKEKNDQGLIRNAIQGFLGGAYGREGFKRFAELLGVHNGPGSEAVTTDIDSGFIPDPSKASSDAASFSTDDVGRIMFGIDGSEGNIEGIGYEDLPKFVGQLDRYNDQLKELESELDQIQKDYPRFRLQAEETQVEVTERDESGRPITRREPLLSKDATEQEWQKVRDNNARLAALKKGDIYEKIAVLREQRGNLYTEGLRSRLESLRSYFSNNQKQKLQAIDRLRFNEQYGKENAEAAFDEWLEEQIIIVNDAQKRSDEHKKEMDKQVADLQKELAKVDPSQLVQAQIQLMPTLRRSFKRNTKNVSATNLVRLSHLFSNTNLEATDRADQPMIIRATADISNWQVERSRNVIENGNLVLDETVGVVEAFVKEGGTLKKRQVAQARMARAIMEKAGRLKEYNEAARMSVNEAIIRTKTKLIDAELMASDYGYTLEEMLRLVTEQDIKELLRSKNIFLRGTLTSEDTQDKGVVGNVGSRLERETGTGVDSTPFRKLLTDMTGAVRWQDASEAQRLLMYSRLLQLPSHRIKSGVIEGQIFQPLYLPDFYQTEQSQKHLNLIVEEVVGDRQGIEGNINKIKEHVKTELKGDFDSKIFDESLASLIEAGILTHASYVPQKKRVKGIPAKDVKAVAPGDLGSESNPRIKNIDKKQDVLLETTDTEFDEPLPDRSTAGQTKLQKIRQGKQKELALGHGDTDYNVGDVVLLKGSKRDVVTEENLQKELNKYAPKRESHVFSLTSKVKFTDLSQPIVFRGTLIGPIKELETGFLDDRHSLETKEFDPLTGEAGGVAIEDDVIGSVNMKSIEHAFNAQRVNPERDKGGVVWYNPNSDALKGKFNIDEEIGDIIRITDPTIRTEEVVKQERAMVANGWVRGRRFADNALRRALYNIAALVETQLVSPTKTQPGILPMNFRDGDGGLSMQPQFKGASTFDLIKSGNRTGTSRTSINKNYKVGDVIEVKGRGKEKILVEIQAHGDGSVWKKVSDIPAQEWMASEGWDQNAYDTIAKKGYFQLRYKYLDPAQVTTPTPKTQAIATFVDDSSLAAQVSNILGNKLKFNRKTRIVRKHTKRTWRETYVEDTTPITEEDLQDPLTIIVGQQKFKSRNVAAQKKKKVRRQIFVRAPGLTAQGKPKTSPIYYEEIGPWLDSLELDPLKVDDKAYENLLEAKFSADSDLTEQLMLLPQKLEEKRKKKRGSGLILERIRLKRNREMHPPDRKQNAQGDLFLQPENDAFIMTPRGMIRRIDATPQEIENADNNDPVKVIVDGKPTLLSWDFDPEVISEIQSEVAEAKALVLQIESMGLSNAIEQGDERMRRVARIMKLAPKKYAKKEGLKAALAPWFIGEGVPNSSTDRYLKSPDYGVNNIQEGYYPHVRKNPNERQTVFVAANGNRKGRVPAVDKDGNLLGRYQSIQFMIEYAIKRGLPLPVFVLDAKKFADLSYNIGEREVAKWLTEAGYRRIPNLSRMGDMQKEDTWLESKSGIWVPTGAVHFAMNTQLSAEGFDARVNAGEKRVPIRLFAERDVDGLVEIADRKKRFWNEYRRTALVPYETGPVPLRDVDNQLIQDPFFLAPWSADLNKNTRGGFSPTNVLSSISSMINRNMFPSIDELAEGVEDPRNSVANSLQMLAVLNDLGKTSVDWNFNNLVIPDKDLPTVEEIESDPVLLEEFNAYIGDVYKNTKSESSGLNVGYDRFADLMIGKEDFILYKKYEKLFRKINPDTQVPIVVASDGKDAPASNITVEVGPQGIVKEFILLRPNQIKESFKKKKFIADYAGQIIGSVNPNTPIQKTLVRKLDTLDDGVRFATLDDYFVFVIAHEKAHSQLRSAEVGTTSPQKDVQTTSLAIYEDAINNLALAEQTRVMSDQIEDLKAEQNRKERDKPLPPFDGDTVRVNRDYFNEEYADIRRHLSNYATGPETPMQWNSSPGSEDRMEIDRQVFEYNTSPKRVLEILEDKELSGSVQKLVDDYNKINPEDKMSKGEFIERYASHVVSRFGLAELAEMGILDTVEQRVKMASDIVPASTFLDISTPEGSKVISALIAEGAIPSSLRKRSMAIRQEFVSTIKTRFEVLQKNIEEVLKTLRIPDNIKVQFVDDLNGLFQGMSQVALRGEMLPQTQAAIYDSATNRIIVNLAAIDPNEMVEAQEIILEAGLHEAVHALIRRDHLYDAELSELVEYIRNNIVPKEWDSEAHDMGVTWFERSVYNNKDTNLNEGDIEEEAMTDLMVALAQNKVPDAMVKNKKVRKTKGFLQDMFEGIVGATRDSNIIEVLQVFANIESGRTGSRGSGYQGDTEFTETDEIRNTRLVRYADPKQIKELTKAVALLDAATNPEMMARQQANVDAIADKIVQQRTEIQETAGEVSQIQAITNIRQGVEEVREENSYAIPLLNGEVWTNSRDREARQAALDEFLKARRGEIGYTMPSRYMNMFNSKHRVTNTTKSLIDSLVKEGAVSKVDGDTFRKSLKDGTLSGDSRAGNNPKETQENLEKGTVSQMRFQYLDRRQWTVEQTDRILAAQDRAMLDARTSALVAWRNADNTVNWLGGMLKAGPLSYLGPATGKGEFDLAPVYDDQLAEKYGGDGRVKGLLDIFAFVSQPIDEQVATAYGEAKRIQWTKKRRDDIRRMLLPRTRMGMKPAHLRREFQDAELQRELEIAEKAYNKINLDEKGKERWTDEKMQEVISKVEADEAHIIEFWDNYQAYNRANIRLAYDSGLITREQRDVWLEMPYTPFYRETNEAESFPIGSGQQMAMRGRVNVQKALQGSEAPVSKELMENIMINTQALVRDAMINVAASRTARDSVALNEGRPISVSSMAGNIDNRVIRVMEQGVVKHYELDDAQQAMAVMMLGFNPKKRIEDLFGGMKLGEYVSTALTGTSQVLREAVTRTPPFQIKNILRDSWQAATVVGGGPGLVIDAIANALDPDVQRRAEERGLSIGIDFVAEPGEYGNLMQKELDKADLDWTNPLTPFSALWTFLGKIAKQSEVATRVAVYDRVLAMTGDRALAQYLAIEIMNYGRRGANPALSTYMATVPFMNGRLQGMDVVYRGLRSKKGSSDVPSITAYGMTQSEYANLPWWEQNRAQIANRGLVLTAATMLMYWLMSDDEEYQDLREEVKADNWLFPMGDHAWLKIPVPFEVGVIFKVIPEQIMKAMMEKEYDAFDVGGEITRQLRTSLSIGAPQLIGPLFGAMRNYDTYRKDYIVDPFMESGVSPNEQRNRFTSNTARTIADAVNMIPLVNNLPFLTSPMKMEYMLRQYFGTMGGYVTTVADRVARMGILPTIPFDPLMNWSEAESIVGTSVDFDWRSLIGGPGVANVPILGDLLTDPRTRAGRQQQFYELVQELDQVVGTLNSITEKDRMEGIDYANKHRELLNKKSRIRSMERRMKMWRDRRDREFDIPRESLTDEQKRERYESLLDTRIGILYGMDELLKDEKRARKPFRWSGK